MTYEEIKKEHPVDYAARERNKMTYRYPRGESYQDLCSRYVSDLESFDSQSVYTHYVL